jgi:uncharacterized protein (DUF885 family)
MDETPLHPYVDWLFAADPILASTEGEARGDADLGAVDPDARAQQDRERASWLAAAEATEPAAPGTVAELERQVLLTELRTAVRREESERPAERVPYWYPERLGEALSTVMADRPDPAALTARLRAVPEFLAQAERNLTTDAPRLWAEMGAAGARGLERFVTSAVPAYARTLPDYAAADVERAVGLAAPAVGSFATFAEGLVNRAVGEWRCGTEQFEFLLRTYHHLDVDAAGLGEYGRDLVERERAELERLAAQRDPGKSWQQQIDEIKDAHPQPADFLATYGEAMDRSLAHTREHGLIDIPDGAVCEMDWVPEYRRDGLPLGVMAPSPPYAPGLHSLFLITPADASADETRRRQHMRDNCYVFATTIAGHETYPGHHLQYVHHKLGTPRDSIRRYFRTPQFVEGWGLYVEDLLVETGFLADDRARLVKQRNALWRALRVVVDVGLHTGTLSVAEATELMQREAGMEPHMAAGEVRRYTRHDNPTYPSSYALGRDLIHRLRAARPGPARAFHDWLLSFGSPPLPLLARLAG